MAKKSVIRGRRQHQVALDAARHTAQSRTTNQDNGRSADATPASAPPPEPVAPEPRRSTARSAGAAATKPAPASPPSPASVPAAPRRATVARKRPADSARAPRPLDTPDAPLWETNSAVQQRLQTLIERNQQLHEQLQRLQGNPA